jgi:uncharacterized protein (TIGR00299 family) protein
MGAASKARTFMRFAYFDCFNGASGDMILGGLIDAGLSLDGLRQKLAGLNLPGYTIKAEKVRKQGFAATQFHVDIDPGVDKPHRHLSHIRAILEAATLSTAVKARAALVFERLAEAEARAHGTTIEKVHFHEVGAIDAIVDVVGACIGLEDLGVERVACSPIPVGSGVIQCEHGEMPIPAPATAILLEKVPIAASVEPGELTTPTGAAILTSVSNAFGPMPSMTLEAVGCGAGRRDGTTRPNILRVMLGRSTDVDLHAGLDDEGDEVVVLEANIDDSTAETIGHACERMLSAGALDVYCTPIVMKKNRPAVKVTILCHPQTAEALEEMLFLETPTFGIRQHRAVRRKLHREQVTVQTRYGPIRMKVGRRGGKVMTVSPEYEDCRAAALDSEAPLRQVMDAARQAWQATQAAP